MSNKLTSSIQAPAIKAKLDKLRGNIAQVIRGKDEVIEQVVTSLIANGHVLIEDLPGLGKTTLAYCLARSVACDFARVQFTSDMLPSDVIGVAVYDELERQFIFKPGPVFTNILLADEINRTTPKTQSALLEVMDRSKVTVDGVTHSIDAPFMVIATQNPVDYESAFPLPESQMDRFLMRLQMGYPGYDQELEILKQRNNNYDRLEIQPVLSQLEVNEIQLQVAQVFIEDSILHYILKLIAATRTEAEFRSGASTRATIALKHAAQAAALVNGRAFVVPEDVGRVYLPVLTHRISLRRQTSDPMEERRAVEGVLHKIFDSIPMPT